MPSAATVPLTRSASGRADSSSNSDPIATMPPKFIYFDLGNVLLNFSDERACRQMAAVCGATPEAVADAMFPVA